MTVCAFGDDIFVNFEDDSSGHSSESGNPGGISSFNISEKNNIDSCLKISGITKNTKK